MGTLFDQPNRDYLRVSNDRIEGRIAELQILAKKRGCSLSEVISVMDSMERERYNSLYVRNGDAWDEQIGGMGELVKRFTVAIESIYEQGLLFKESER